MKNLTKNNWIPVCVSLPDTHRVVIVQVADLPDPTIASYWPETGKWVCEEIGYEEVTMKMALMFLLGEIIQSLTLKLQLNLFLEQQMKLVL